MIPPEETDYLRQIREAVERGEFDEENDPLDPKVKRIIPQPLPETIADQYDPKVVLETAQKWLDTADLKARVAQLHAGRIRSAQSGKTVSRVPFGYVRPPKQKKEHAVAEPIVPDPVTAPIVQAIFREYLRQRSMKKLVAWLERLYPGVRRWSRAGVAYILKNPVYRGTVRFGAVRATGKHQAIVAPVIYNKVQQLIRRNDKRAHMRGGEA